MLSGVEWSVDDQAGLNGVADFLLCRSALMLYISAPVLVAVEAKRDSIPDGLGTMRGRNGGRPAVQPKGRHANRSRVRLQITTGATWRFLRLSGTQLDIDVDEYAINQPDRILGVLLHCCGVTV